jgi:hypothetical protein
MDPILGSLESATTFLQRLELATDAPPAFLLDSRRQTEVVAAEPGRFDNRWMTFPQDLPSCGFLISRGIRAALLVQHERIQPLDDLAHVLLRWQEGSLALLSVDAGATARPQPLVVQRPRRFRSMWYRVMAILGLQRNAAGGFGSVIPESSGSG